MKGKPFRFKQFTIHQDQCAQKVGTDGVLLGAWTDSNNAKTILDIGTGTGLISLMLAQRSASICLAIEINDDAAEQCAQNFKDSPWHNKLILHHSSIQSFTKNSSDKFDLIVSNPPFFETQRITNQRSTARSEQELTLKELIENVAQLLSAKGRFSVIFPMARESELINNAALHQLKPHRICAVKGNVNSASKRVLIEFGFEDQKTSHSELVIEKDKRHDYTEEYKTLCADYLTIF